jgi:hypothetical protein
LMDLLEPLEAEIVALATNHPAEDTPPVPAETLPSSPSSSRVPVT